MLLRVVVAALAVPAVSGGIAFAAASAHLVGFADTPTEQEQELEVRFGRLYFRFQSGYRRPESMKPLQEYNPHPLFFDIGLKPVALDVCLAAQAVGSVPPEEVAAASGVGAQNG